MPRPPRHTAVLAQPRAGGSSRVCRQGRLPAFWCGMHNLMEIASRLTVQNTWSQPKMPPGAKMSRRHLVCCGAQVEAYVASVRREVLSFAGQTVAPGTSAAGSSAAGEAEAVERMRRLCMVCEHERQHQETLCYMAAQQRKADAAAIAAGRSPVLAVPGGGGAAAQAAAGATLPFYLQQCSYASASTRAAPLAFPASNTLQQSRPWEPGTPARQAETLPRRLAALQLGGSRAGHNGRDAGPGDGGDDFVTVPGGEVSAGALAQLAMTQVTGPPTLHHSSCIRPMRCEAHTYSCLPCLDC